MIFNLQKSIEILERTPLALKAMLGGLSSEWIHQNEGPDTWSPFDIIGHLVHGELTDWIPRTRILLAETGDKTFDSFDRFAQFETSKEKTMDQLLDEFEELRNRNLEELKAMKLTKSALNIEGNHPELGRVKLKHHLATWTVHDMGHLAQISRVMARQYQDEVGPWGAYLRILG